MTRLFRSPNLAAIALSAVLAAVLVAVLAAVPVASSGFAAPAAPTASPKPSPKPSPTADPTATPPPTPSPTGCQHCLKPLDAICWEFVAKHCDIRLALNSPSQTTITVRYSTFPITAKPQVDYLDVLAGTVQIEPGALWADATVELIPNADQAPGKTFGVAFFNPSGAQLTRPEALVTLKPPAN